MLIHLHDKSLVDVNVHSMAGSSSTSFRWCIFKPSTPRMKVSSLGQGIHFLIGPTGHCERLASMADGLVAGLALIADKGVKFNAHRGKAKLFLVATIGAFGVCFELCKLLYAIFRHGGHSVSFVVQCYLLLLGCGFVVPVLLKQGHRQVENEKWIDSCCSATFYRYSSLWLSRWCL